MESILGGVSYTPPATYSLALCTGDPNAGGVECSGTGYARINLTNNTTNWVTVGGTNYRAFQNGTNWLWSSSAGAGWGSPNWVAFYVSGVLYMGMEIGNASPILTGDIVQLSAAAMLAQILA